MESIFKSKLENLSKILIENCYNENKKMEITNKIYNMKMYEIIYFINFITPEIIENEKNKLIKEFCLNDNEIVQNEIKNFLEYFLNVKEILLK